MPCPTTARQGCSGPDAANYFADADYRAEDVNEALPSI